MRNLLLYPLLATLMLPFVSCKERYLIAGVSDNMMLDGSRIYLKKEVGDKWIVVDSCEVLHGKFKMSGELDSIFITSLFVDDVAVMPLVVESGEAKVTIDPRYVTVQGTELNEKLQQFFKARGVICDSIDEYISRESKLVLDGYNMEEIAILIRDSVENAVHRIEEYTEGFVKEHYHNPLGPFVFSMLCNMLPSPHNSPVVARIMKDAPEVFRRNPSVQEFIADTAYE